MKTPKYIEPKVTVYSVLRTKNQWLNDNEKLLSITDDEWKSIKDEAIRVDEENKKVTQVRQNMMSVAKKLMREIFPINDKVIKYIDKQRIPWRNHSYYMDSYNTSQNKVAALKEQQVDKERLAESKKKADAVTEEAIVWLTAKGKKLGVDFNIVNAIETADQIAFDEEINKLIKSGDIFAFSGKDDCEDCAGWNGIDRRCNCGNRRVEWEWGHGHSFKEPRAVAVAY